MTTLTRSECISLAASYGHDRDTGGALHEIVKDEPDPRGAAVGVLEEPMMRNGLPIRARGGSVTSSTNGSSSASSTTRDGSNDTPSQDLGQELDDLPEGAAEVEHQVLDVLALNRGAVESKTKLNESVFGGKTSIKEALDALEERGDISITVKKVNGRERHVISLEIPHEAPDVQLPSVDGLREEIRHVNEFIDFIESIDKSSDRHIKTYAQAAHMEREDGEFGMSRWLRRRVSYEVNKALPAVDHIHKVLGSTSD